MHTRSIVLAAVVAALAGLGNQAWGQYDPAAYGGAPPPMYGGGAARQAGFGRIGGTGAMNGGMGANMTQPPSCGYDGYPGGGGGYGDSGCCDCCPAGAWCHHIGVFAEGLYLRPRGAEVAYAVAVTEDQSEDGPGPYQVDHVRVLDPDYQPGFRGGINFACGECSMFELSYTRVNADADDFYQLEGGLGVVISELVGPDLLNSAGTNLDSEAILDIKWEQIDADYLGLLAYCDSYRVAYSVGVRYSKLDQEFAALYSPNDVRLVASNIEFEGVGLTFGGLAERYCGCNHNLYVYGKSEVAFLGGEFRAAYLSATEIGQGPFVDTSWKAGRLVTVHDMEVGVGWQNCSGCIRLQTGFMYSVWYNVVKTQEWVNAVQENNFADPSDNFYGLMSFDGFTSRVEFLW